MRTKRWCLAGLVIFGAGVARAEDTVTLHMMARPLGDVVAEVARQSQLSLGVDRSAAGLPVFISVKNMPVKVFLERLKAATGTEWLAEGPRVVLSKAGPLRAARALESRLLAQRLERQIDNYLKGSTSNLDWSAAALNERVRKIIARRDEHHKRDVTEFAYHVENETPYHLVIKEFLERVPASVFTNLAPNSNLVFSTRPNALQVSLPYQPKAPAVARALEAELHGRLVQAGVRFWSKSGHDVAAAPVRPPLDRLVVRVERNDLTYFSFAAHLVGPAGEIISTSTYSAIAHPEWSSITVGQYPSGTVRLNPRSVEFAKSYLAYRQLQSTRYRSEDQGSSLGGGVFDGCTSESLKQLMRQPTKYDPLSFVVADVLEGLAEQTQSQLIAMVPDSLLGQLAQSGGKGEISFEALWLSSTMFSFNKDEHGWLIRPRSFAAAGDEFADRAGLERLVQEPTLRDLARYATTMDTHWSMGSVDFLWLDLLQSHAHRGLLYYGDQLKLLDSLPSQAWPVGQGSSVRIPLSAVPAHLKSRVVQVLLRDASGIGYEMLAGRTPTEIAQRESTELLGDGFADRVYVVMSREGKALLATLKDGLLDGLLTPYNYGKLGSGAPSELMIVNADRLTIGFAFGEGQHGQAILNLQRLREPRKVFTAPSLPEPLRSEVERGKKASGPG